MSSLTSCLRSASGLHPEDKTAIQAAARKYGKQGMSARDAALKAVDERIAEVDGMPDEAPASSDQQVTAEAAQTPPKIRVAPPNDEGIVATSGPTDAPGERKFYVTMIRDDKVARLVGPFDTKEAAEAMVDPAREAANQADFRSAFDAFGVSAVTSENHRPGVLNKQLGVDKPKAPEPPPADEPSGEAALSRSADREANAAWQAIADNDKLFALPKSSADTIEAIAQDIAPGIKVKAHLAEGLDRYTITLPESGRTAEIVVRQPSPWGPHSYGVGYDSDKAVTVRPGETAESMRQVPDVYINVAKLKTGDGGARVYAIAADFAHNTGAVFIGDPGGVTADAMRRRAEAMMSSALRWGTTEHLAPHPRQVQGNPAIGVEPLEWKFGDDLGNLERLVELNLKAAQNAGYDESVLSFDASTGRFRDSDGKEISRADIELSASAGLGGGALAGGRTLARAAVLRALLRGAGSSGEGRGGRNGLLARFAKLASDSPQTVGALLKRDEQAAQSPQARRGLSPERAQALAKQFGPDLDIGIVERVDDMPPSEQRRVFDKAPNGDIRGVYFRGSDKIWLVTENLHSEREAAFVVLHEAFHRGLAKTIGGDAKRLLKRMYLTNGKLHKLADAQVKLHKIGLDEAIEEALADLAGKGEARDLRGWDKLLDSIRNWLSALGKKIGLDITWTDDMIADFVAGIRREGLTGGVHVNTAGGMMSRMPADANALGQDADGSGADSKRTALTPYERAVLDRRSSALRMRAEGGSLADYDRKSQHEWLRGSAPPRDGRLKLYRALANEQGVMPGDYVTNSRAYAEQHLRDNMGGNGRVVEFFGFLDEIFPADGPGEFWYAPRSLSEPIAPDESGAALSRTAQDLAPGAGGVFDFNRLGETRQDRIRTIVDGSRPFWLGALTRDQLADIYGKDIAPVKEYDTLTRAMENQRSKIAQDADTLYSEWAKIGGEANDRLARVMLDATVHSVHPDGAFTEIAGADNAERKAVHDRVAAEFKALPPQAQAMYGKVRDFHTGMLGQLKGALEKRIERQVQAGKARAAAITSIQQAFDRYKEHGPYFPLSRFGDYLVIGNRPDGERVVASYATPGEQQAAARNLRRDGFSVKTKAAKEYTRSGDGSAGKFAGDVLTMLNDLDMTEASVGGKAADLKSKLLDDVNQLFIRALPDLSYRKHFQHRKNTPGFSSDVMRGFASSAFHAASHIARLNHADQMTFALDDAYKAVDALDEGDFNKPTQVLNELSLRHEAALNPNTHPIAAMLNQVGFVMYLGASPAAGLVNLLQTPMVTLPYLGARHGFAKATAAMAAATKDIMGAKANRASGWNAADSPKLTTRERETMRKLQDEGVIDLTQAHDLAAASGLDTGNVARSKAAFAMARAMKIVGWTFHVPEVMNRQVTALTAYRLEMEKSKDQAKAEDAAREAIKRTHFDYSGSNRARYMQGNLARVMLQFKTYSQNMTYLLGRAAYISMKGESPEVRSIARRQLVATLAATFTMAGTLGLPGLGAAAGLIGMLVGALDDDDKPWEWKAEFRNLMADTVGKEAGEVLAHGIPRALMPWDLASRVGMGDLWFRSNDREGQSPREAFATDMANILGPTAGTLLGLYTAADHMARGNWGKAAESMVPKAIRDPLQARRLASEGVTSYTGEHLMDLNEAEVLGKLLGFAPTRVAEMYEGRNAVKNAETAIGERRKLLVGKVARARMQGDSEGASEAMEEIQTFNRRNPREAIKGATIAASILARRRHERQTQDGTYLPKNRDHLREQGRFASDR